MVAGESEHAFWLIEAAAEAGWDVATPWDADGEVPALIVDCGEVDGDPPLQGGPQLLLCDGASLAAQDPGGTAAGFHVALPARERGAIELTRSETTSPAAANAATSGCSPRSGGPVEWVGDAPGLVSGRILAQLVNEACFALGEGVGSAADIDTGMRLGLNHPRGPLAWGDAIGPAAVLETLTGLWDEYREERYRPAPALVARAVRAESDLLGDTEDEALP